ncbi:8995_t:CDS:1 [Funneliformis geosporum]|uniref:8995_t:CDS:1 n=1 Tax=Funneliformis geosporum TaxID=1117311 RepID=A0A9W4SEH7_9GLOM|nr:8995_t:CDS:1 [Funneliformis geosporum]
MKKEPNMFLLYRREMMKHRRPNVSMTEFSKFVSKEWKNLSDHEKMKWKRNYQMSRDKELQNKVSTSPIANENEYRNSIAISNSVNKDLSTKLKKDCFLTECPSEEFLNNDDDIIISIFYNQN